MADNKDSWQLKTALDVAKCLDWTRRRMNAKGKGLVLIAISENAIAFAKDPSLDAKAAARMVWQELDSLERGFENLAIEKVTRGFARRTPGDAHED